MPSEKTTHRLNAEHREFVCRMFAEFATPSEVMKALEEQHGINLANHQAVQHYRDSEKWRPIIEEMRTALIFNINRLPIASKYWRLKQLQDLFNSENRYRVVRYAKVNEHDYTPIEELPLGELRNLLRQAAEELGELRERITVEHTDGRYQAEFADGPQVYPSTAAELPN